jgi:hypothetical protein
VTAGVIAPERLTNFQHLRTAHLPRSHSDATQ